MSGTIFSLPHGYGYAGKGVKRTDADRIIFWYSLDERPRTYTAVFGDLRVEEVPADRIPTTRPAQQ